jgi:uridine kinase
MDTFDRLAGVIVSGSGRRIVAIDGIDGAGKSRLSAALAETLRRRDLHVIEASVDGFLRPRRARYARGRTSAEGFYWDSFDYDALRSMLLDPFDAGGPVVTEVFDVVTDEPIHAQEHPVRDDTILLLDGIFLHRPELVDRWHLSVWLDVPRAIAEQRMYERDGPNTAGDRYAAGQAIYRELVDPMSRADVIIDNSDFLNPRVVHIRST